MSSTGLRWLPALALATMAACARPEATTPSGLDAAVGAVCEEKTVLLGEDAHHGDGATHALKTAMVVRLVEDCGFDQVLFEAGLYEFADIARLQDAGEAVSPKQFRAAVGGLWSETEDFAPLVTFLVKGVNDGRVRVGGLDDRTSQRGQDFANEVMAGKVMSALSPDRAAECADRLRRRIYVHLPENRPYDEAAKVALLDCIGEASSALDGHVWESVMLGGLERFIARDLSERDERIAGRAASMTEALDVWQPDGERKTIVWMASVHAAQHRREADVSNFGSLVARRRDVPPVSIGFSALSGQTRLMDGSLHDIEALPGSLEAWAFSEAKEDRDAVFLSRADLKEAGTRPGSVFSSEGETRDWSDVFDGVVVFRTQRPKTPRSVAAP